VPVVRRDCSVDGGPRQRPNVAETPFSVDGRRCPVSSTHAGAVGPSSGGGGGGGESAAKPTSSSGSTAERGRCAGGRVAPVNGERLAVQIETGCAGGSVRWTAHAP